MIVRHVGRNLAYILLYGIPQTVYYDCDKNSNSNGDHVQSFGLYVTVI